MAFTAPRTWVTGEVVTASLLNVHIRDNEDYFKGNAGIVAIASGMSFAHGTITTDLNTLGATVTWNAGGVTFTAIELNVTNTASAAASLLMDLQVGGASKFNVSKAGALYAAGTAYINDTSNAGATLGLTINQGSASDEIIAAKSSSVAHGITDVAETDTFARLYQAVATGGGAALDGLSEVTNGLLLRALGGTTSTSKTTGSGGAVIISGHLKSGTGVTVLGADANILVIKDNTTTRYLFDTEGSAHADVEWIAFDAHDDLALVDALNHEFVRRKDPAHAAVTNEFGAWLDDKRGELQRAGIVNFYDDGPRAMVNTTRLQMLTVGTLRQLGARLARLEQHLGLKPGYTPILMGGA